MHVNFFERERKCQKGSSDQSQFCMMKLCSDWPVNPFEKFSDPVWSFTILTLTPPSK